MIYFDVFKIYLWALTLDQGWMWRQADDETVRVAWRAIRLGSFVRLRA